MNFTNILCEFENLSKFSAIKHFVTTRKGGTSKPPFEFMNLSFETRDDKQNVLKNRQILSETVQIPLQNFVMQNQMHTRNVLVVNQSHKGRGVFDHGESIQNNDAFVTNESDICLFVFGADCVPILFYDTKLGVIGAAHSGWRGTVQKIAQATVEAMMQNYGSSPKNIHVGIGPSIGKCCYEVGDEVCQSVIETYGTDKEFLITNSATHRKHFDLWYANKYQLTEIGIPHGNIEISNICTLCHKDIFFSARSGETGRFGAGIMLKK